MQGWREITSSATWQSLLQGAGRSALQQSWAYGVAVEAAGHGVHRLAWQPGAVPLALAQVLHRRLPLGLGVAILLRGPAWLGTAPDDATIAPLLRALAPWTGRAAVVWQPDDELAAPRRAALRRVWTGPALVRLDLAPPLPHLRSGLAGKWRNRLVRAEAAGLRVQADRAGPRLDWLIAETESQRRARGYAGPAPGFTRILAGASGEDALCLVAERAGKPLAGMLLVRHGRSATYQLGATTAAGRQLSAHHLLLWTGIERLKDSGCTALDLGLVDTVNNPGIARFKLGTGGAALTLAGSYLAPPPLGRRDQAA